MLRLYNGIEIPQVGLGARVITDRGTEYRREYDFYEFAINSGICNLFDTSAAYGNNDEVLGKAILNSHKRDKIRIMSKISNEQQQKGNIRDAFEKHLKYLKLDYLDYYLIHWPVHGFYIKTYREMEKIYEEGMVKAIGVCNCNIHHLKELEYETNIKPMINQFEITPIFTQDALVNYCKAFDIMPVAYSTVGRMHDVLINSDAIRCIAEKYKKSPAQIIIKWNKQLNRVALVQTRNTKHFKEIFSDNDDYDLTDKEIFWINSLNNNIRLRYDPDTADLSRL